MGLARRHDGPSEVVVESAECGRSRVGLGQKMSLVVTVEEEVGETVQKRGEKCGLGRVLSST